MKVPREPILISENGCEKIFPCLTQTDQHYAPLCTAFGCVELELNPPFQNPGSATGVCVCVCVCVCACGCVYVCVCVSACRKFMHTYLWAECRHHIQGLNEAHHTSVRTSKYLYLKGLTWSTEHKRRRRIPVTVTLGLLIITSCHTPSSAFMEKKWWLAEFHQAV